MYVINDLQVKNKSGLKLVVSMRNNSFYINYIILKFKQKKNKKLTKNKKLFIMG